MAGKPHLNIKEVAERYGVSKQTVARWAGSGVFPPPVRVGVKLLRWAVVDLDAYDISLRANAAAIVANFQAITQAASAGQAVAKAAVAAEVAGMN